MNIRFGGAFAFQFYTENTQGVPQNADSLPLAYLYHNGVRDAAVPITVALVPGKIGVYSATGVLPPTYLTGDAVDCAVDVVVGGVGSSETIKSFGVQSILRREAFTPSTSTLQYLEDDGVTPLGGQPALVLSYDTAGNITKR